MVQKFMVEKSRVEKFMVEKSRVLGLKLGAEKSGVEVSFNPASIYKNIIKLIWTVLS